MIHCHALTFYNRERQSRVEWIEPLKDRSVVFDKQANSSSQSGAAVACVSDLLPAALNSVFNTEFSA
jgi:hypothetical protein